MTYYKNFEKVVIKPKDDDQDYFECLPICSFK